MPPSTPSQPGVRPVGEEDGESFESIPWESLQHFGRSGERRRWYLVAGAIVALAIGMSAVRSMVASTPPPALSGSSTAATTTTVPATATTSLAPIVTEADLMAIDGTAMERLVAAAAEAAVSEYFSAEEAGFWRGAQLPHSERATFVEWARAVTVTALDPTRFAVTVAVSVLDGADGEPFVRRATRAVAVLIDVSDGTMRPLDLPTPAALPFDAFEAPSITMQAVDPDVMAAIAAAAAEFGSVSSEPLSYGAAGRGVVRVVAEVTDESGAWPMAFRVGPDLEVLPAGG
jgi:hypothetical protein